MVHSNEYLKKKNGVILSKELEFSGKFHRLVKYSQSGLNYGNFV